MKNIFAIIILCSAFGANAQLNKNIGGGYFGHTLTHPGVVFEFELEKMYSDKMSIPVRFDLGYYHHPRYNDGIFFDISFGSRRYFKNGLFIEQSIGAGIIETFLNEDVFEVDDNGNVSETSKWNKPHFMPSVTLGLGYNLTKKKETFNAIWLRPKIYWQFPYKASSMFNPVVQFGFTHKL